MKIFDTLIIGSCYRALGYALTRPDTVIVEERELCDTQLCLPIYSFEEEKHEPVTELGGSLKKHFEVLSLYQDGMQNTTALEMGFCGFAKEREAEILLKCRVVSTESSDGCYDVKTVSGAGIKHFFAKRVIDMRAVGENFSLTMLFEAESAEALSEFAKSIPDSRIEPAFYAGRYAIHAPIPTGEDRLAAAERLYKAFLECDTKARLLHVAYTVLKDGSDVDFGGPIGALEEGVRLASEVRK
ncbi:MAG: hypothetical protein IJW03_03110 [Clostridia bacterium]|nr:hypothetical protein [Clostridia bacterium]